MTLDPDPLHVPDDPEPRYLLLTDSRRGCSVLPWLVILVILAVFWAGVLTVVAAALT